MKGWILLAMMLLAGCMSPAADSPDGAVAATGIWEPASGLSSFVPATSGIPIDAGTVVEAPFVSEAGRGNVYCPNDPRFSEKFDCKDVILVAESAVLVSQSPDGTAGNDRSDLLYASPDGKTILIRSEATNLVSGDTNGQTDLFLYADEKLERANLGSIGQQDLGTDGSTVKGPYSCVAWCGNGDATADGRFVVFTSWDDGLVSHDDNGRPDVFLRDMMLGTTILISATNEGHAGSDASYLAPFPSSAITDDGDTVVFTSHADNLGASRSTSCPEWDETVRAETLSCPLAYEWTRGEGVRPLAHGTGLEDLQRIEYASITPDGHFVFAVGSHSTDGPSQVYRLNRVTGTVVQITHEQHPRSYPSFSSDGATVVFSEPRDGGGHVIKAWTEKTGLHDVTSTDGLFSFPVVNSQGTLIVASVDPAKLGIESDEPRLLAQLRIN